MGAWLRPVFLRVALVGAGLAAGALLAAAAAEAYLRLFSAPLSAAGPMVGHDPVVGFVYRPGSHRQQSLEFDVVYRINSRGDPDDEPDSFRGVRPLLALGDSHTAATGVEPREAWPNVLESQLGRRCGGPVQVYNMAVGGYSLSQEYLRLVRDGLQLDPSAVLLGFSMATDVYDLLPPDRAIIPYPPVPMQYLDLDGEGLAVRSWPGRPGGQGAAAGGFLGRSRAYDLAKRTAPGLLAVAALRRLGVRVWPTMDFVLAREPDEAQRYAWTLVERVLVEFQRTLDARGVRFLVVVIPYLPQVYDHVWRWAYAFDPGGFDRYAANRRLEGICRRRGIQCLDLTGPLAAAVRAGGRLHYPRDGHPNAEGHAAIAREVLAYLEPRLAAEGWLRCASS